MSKENLVHDPYWNRYISLVSEEEVLPVLESQAGELEKLLGGIDEKKASYRYEPGKWSIKEAVQHITDTERIFQYRALSIARGDTRSLLGFEQDDFAKNADVERRPFREVADELLTVRRSTNALFRSFSQTAWDRVGTANESRISVSALGFVIAGHVRHHIKVLHDKYSV
jgi:hypothetical protein